MYSLIKVIFKKRVVRKYLLARVDKLRTFIVVISMVELSHGLFRLSLYANLGLKVEFSGRLKKLEQLAKPNIFSFSLVSKAESSDKTLTGIFMNKLGLIEPGFENRRAFSKKAREPQK